MRFANVDGEEIGAILIVVVDLRDVADLATEGWSSEAAEDENQRALLQTLSNPKSLHSI